MVAEVLAGEPLEPALEPALESALESALEVTWTKRLRGFVAVLKLGFDASFYGEEDRGKMTPDSFQIFSLLKILKNEKTPLLRNYLTLPLQLNADADEQLLRASEQRVPAFSHDFVPNLLRTKPEPDVETRWHALESKVALTNHDTSAVSELFSAPASGVLRLLTKARLASFRALALPVWVIRPS